MRFYADLHIHSKYSRATSRDADLEHLALWAKRKGITVVGTGDFTHPAWFEEIRAKLLPAEPGLFRLKPEIEREVERKLPPSCHGPVRFLLEVEISTIYKKGDRTRKVHHLIYTSNLDTAGRIRERLGAIGNIAADGRPILGLDSRHLLEITLSAGADAYLIPAHVWTPWFAVLGSKSGFDSVEECYGDLTPYIFAVETGLSSDPPMNWRVPCLDRFTLVSSSDAHSPPRVGREASAFDTELDYFAIRSALETGEGYGGTVEFFPEEGKYHLDGHRACGVCLEPAETRRVQGLCPACGKPLTVGVLHRVEELAGRSGDTDRERKDPFRCLVPLPEVLSELHGVGPKSRSVEQAASHLVGKLGPEIGILERVPLEDVARAGEPLLAEALSRLRAGKVRRESGYDGEYGVIRLFEPQEIRGRAVVAPLFGIVAGPSNRNVGEGLAPSRAGEGSKDHEIRASALPGGGKPLPYVPVSSAGLLDHLDPEQRAAAEIVDGPLLIVAGPGTGKTRTLTHRIAHMICERGIPPERCLALTFSRRAAAEMGERLAALLPGKQPVVATFHRLGLMLIQEQLKDPDLRIASPRERIAMIEELFGLTSNRAERLLEKIGRHRRGERGEEDDGEGRERAAAYEQALASNRFLDFDDLLLKPLALLRERPDLCGLYRERFPWISIDEYQDIDPLQYALVRLLAPPGANLCAIGDPDQSIYGFRGADVRFFLRFREDWPEARVVHLTRSYRSTCTIVEAACQAIRPASLVPDRRLVAVQDRPAEPIVVQSAASERAEAELVVEALERLLGGISSFSFDSGRVESRAERDTLSFRDVAILYRTEAQAPAIQEALGRAGIPFQKRSHRALLDQPGVQALFLALRKRTREIAERGIEAFLHDLAYGLPMTSASSEDLAVLRSAVEMVRPLALRAGNDPEQLLAELALGGEVDTWDPRAEGVSLLTLHASKGLEFPVVFLVGCEDGLLPLVWPGKEADLAEERRLFFVGITRARSRLFLLHSRRRMLRGQTVEAPPSPFLADLEERLLERREGVARARKPEQMKLL
ncbi:MAG: UvrD-helicase domain-containing protein [Thermoanaerobaculia bacterium]